MKTPTWKERLRMIMDITKAGQQQLAKDFGVSGSALSAWIHLDRNPSIDKIENFLKTRPGFNPIWVITGEGEPLKVSQAIEKGVREKEFIDETKLKKEFLKLWGKIIQLEKQVSELTAELKEVQSTSNSPKSSKQTTSSSSKTSKNSD